MAAFVPGTHYRVYFAFENETDVIVEIQRTDIESEDKGKLFHWLLIQTAEGTVDRLQFVAMGTTPEGKQSRTFLQGILVFDTEGAEFLEESYRTVDLLTSSRHAAVAQQLIAQYLSQLGTD